MANRVLVAYASKYGATEEIAERIGAVLREAGLTVDVQPVKRVAGLGDYGAVVLGSAAYIGSWRKEATKFLKEQAGTLAGKAVWIFSSGPTGEGDPVELTKGWKYSAGLQPAIDQVQPRDTALFHGSIKAEKLSFIEKFMIKQVGAPVGDFRDWDAIAAWAKEIAGAIQREALTV
jgi:menaquinone-dependent protoporphyrinogen oxidase